MAIHMQREEKIAGSGGGRVGCVFGAYIEGAYLGHREVGEAARHDAKGDA